MIPPCVDQHPDVFSDPEFSLTQLGTSTPDSFSDSLDVASSQSPQQEQKKAGKGGEGREEGEGEERRERRKRRERGRMESGRK